ncbi:type II toxin-antitoxin system YafQ family toxin [Enterococcus faecium]|nr:type II toxin-antitoxin system YafQ family toxin [Enterococcus faecium]
MNKLKLRYTNRFKKQLKKALKMGYKEKDLQEVVELLQTRQELPKKYKNHNLVGNYSGFKELHIKSDWLLIYQILEDELVLLLIETGTHTVTYFRINFQALLYLKAKSDLCHQHKSPTYSEFPRPYITNGK